MDNFIEMVCEDIDNAIMNSPDVEEYLKNGGSITFKVDKTGTTIKQKGGRQYGKGNI